MKNSVLILSHNNQPVEFWSSRIADNKPAQVIKVNDINQKMRNTVSLIIIDNYFEPLSLDIVCKALDLYPDTKILYVSPTFCSNDSTVKSLDEQIEYHSFDQNLINSINANLKTSEKPSELAMA